MSNGSDPGNALAAHVTAIGLPIDPVAPLIGTTVNT